MSHHRQVRRFVVLPSFLASLILAAAPFANAGLLDTTYYLNAFAELPEPLDWLQVMNDPTAGRA